MRKYLAVLVTVLLVAGAFFLPSQFSSWEDQRLIDQPHITSEDEREGFAESLQLTVAEKLLLLLDKKGLSTVDIGVELGPTQSSAIVGGLFTTPASGENSSAGRIEHNRFSLWGDGEVPPEDSGVINNASAAGVEDAWADVAGSDLEAEILHKWDERLKAAWTEVRGLQSMGGLPELWPSGSELDFLGYGEELYVDSDTHMSFQIYRITLSAELYTLEMTIDEQSGRIFAFTLRCGKDFQPNWGLQGPSNFGPAWRDYWRLDSVSSTWYSPYNKEILESPPEVLRNNGDYNSNGQIVFSYDGQSLPVSLTNWVSTAWGASLSFGVS